MIKRARIKTRRRRGNRVVATLHLSVSKPLPPDCDIEAMKLALTDGLWGELYGEFPGVVTRLERIAEMEMSPDVRGELLATVKQLKGLLKT